MSNITPTANMLVVDPLVRPPTAQSGAAAEPSDHDGRGGRTSGDLRTVVSGWYSARRVTTKVLLIVGVLAIVACSSGLVVLRSLSDVQRAGENVYTQAMTPALQTADIKLLILSKRNTALRHASAPDVEDKNGYAATFREEAASLDALIAGFPATEESGNKARIDELLGSVRAYDKIMLEQYLPASVRGDAAELQQLRLQTSPLVEQGQAVLDELIEQQIANVDRINNEVAASYRSARNVIILLVLIGLPLAALIARRVIRSADKTRQLQSETDRLSGETAVAQDRERLAADELRAKVDSMLATVALAATGDLTSQVEVSGTDAIGQMGDALTKLLSMLRSSVSTIAGNSDALAAAAEELQVVSGQMGVNSAETSKQVSLVTSASIEVTRNVETVAAGAEEMAASIKEIARNTSAAAKVAAEAVEAAGVTNATVGRLGESSAEIDQIVKVITGIAQQTNLLALNATIEAARAGEAGKGFAVVANEVKELAKETAKATEDISARIETIQTETRMSVESITGIVSIIDQIAEFQNTIASAVEQQAATTSEMARSVSDASGGSAEIAANMQNVSSAADSTASGASDSQGAASELARMASELKTLVGQFTY